MQIRIKLFTHCLHFFQSFALKGVDQFFYDQLVAFLHGFHITRLLNLLLGMLDIVQHRQQRLNYFLACQLDQLLAFADAALAKVIKLGIEPHIFVAQFPDFAFQFFHLFLQFFHAADFLFFILLFSHFFLI